MNIFLVANNLVAIQQPVGSNSSTSFPEIAAAAKGEHEKEQDMVGEESSRTTGGPTPVGNIIFGSRLAGPATKPAPSPEEIRIVEGIKVPPRPEEPDNCCMS
jgi:hypothetical protein